MSAARARLFAWRSVLSVTPDVKSGTLASMPMRATFWRFTLEGRAVFGPLSRSRRAVTRGRKPSAAA